MRTDPQAIEVRGIVEKVFSRYVPGQDREPAEWPANRFTHRFPRVYRPEPDAGAEVFGNQSPGINETILIDQGRYVARSYRIEGYLAMWLVGVGILQFYDDAGNMLATINLFESFRGQRMAA